MELKKEILRAVTLAKTEQTHPNYDLVSELADEYLANITGVGIENYLKQYTVRESKEMFEQRLALTNSINPAVTNSLMKPFYKVSRNNNVTAKFDFKAPKLNEKIAIMLNDFNGDKIDQTAGFDMWLKTRFVELTFGDPNGFVVIEWTNDDILKTIQPRPFEVSAKDAINFEYKGAELQWLFVRSGNQFYKAVGNEVKVENGKKFTFYGIGLTIALEQIDKKYYSDNFIELQKDQTFIKIGNDDFIQTIYFTKLGFVPAFRVGYARDLSTKGNTYVNPFHSALPYLRKALKTTSELDITMTGHVFPQKLQYIQACTGASSTEQCFNGKDPQGGTCSACNGTGFKTITTAQEAIYLKMPEFKDDFIPLNDLLVYKSPPIELVEFQNKYVKELKQEAHLAMYNSNMFVTPEIQTAKTATEVDSNTEGVYDTLEPFTEKFSKVYRLVTYTCAVLAGFNETSSDFKLLHQFPADPKLKTASILLSDLAKVNESGAPSFTRDAINNDIAEIIFKGDDEGLLRYKVQHDFFPFNGKTEAEIGLFLSSQYVSENVKILYSNFDSIFTEIEFKIKGFYLKTYAAQKVIVEEFIEQFKSIIIKKDPFQIDFTSTVKDDADNSSADGENEASEGAGENPESDEPAGEIV